MESQELISKMTELLDGHASATSQLSAESQSTLYTMAYQFYRSGKFEEARHFFRFLAGVNPLDRRFWMGLAASYQMLKDYQPAIECYSVAAVQNPDDPYAHWHAAECFFAQGNQAQALGALESALTVARQDEKYRSLVLQLELVHFPQGGIL